MKALYYKELFLSVKNVIYVFIDLNKNATLLNNVAFILITLDKVIRVLQQWLHIVEPYSQELNLQR